MPGRRSIKNLKGTKAVASRKKSGLGKKALSSKKTVTKKKAKVAASPKPAPKDETLQVFDLNGKEEERMALDPMFQGEVNTDVVYQSVLKYQAGRRVGTASTLDRGHVSGGGKKPWKQKGTGQARHGSRRSPIWRHGGVTFGPMPRDYSYSLPLEIRRRGLVEGVKEKVAAGKLILLKDLRFDAPRTKLMAGLLKIFKLEKPVVLVEEKSRNLLLASRNISAVSIKTAMEINALDVLSHRECVMTKAAYLGLVKRLKS
ncbi:MAG: 50S ribosomal protein L4 [Candidatus Omnitrophica bacterium]|nr:50S ribosomal protein L4 [Candidatus Omnitrophota bacterium]